MINIIIIILFYIASSLTFQKYKQKLSSHCVVVPTMINSTTTSDLVLSPRR